MEELNNRQRKKEAAYAHNTMHEISQNLLQIGQCSCGKGELFMYLKSDPENICNMYCTYEDCPTPKRDFRKIDEYRDCKFLFGPSAITATLVTTYGPDAIEKALAT